MLVTSIPTRRLPFPCGTSRLEQPSKCKALTGGNIQRSWREIKQAGCEQRGPLGQPTIVTSLILNYAHFAGRKRSGSYARTQGDSARRATRGQILPKYILEPSRRIEQYKRVPCAPDPAPQRTNIRWQKREKAEYSEIPIFLSHWLEHSLLRY